MRIASKQIATKSMFSVGFFVVLFAISGLRLIDIAVIVFLTSIQVAVGAFVWLVYRSKHQVGFAEVVGMGATIGFALALISSQLFRTVAPKSYSWAILPLIALGLSLMGSKGKTLNFTKSNSKRNLTEIYILVSGTLIALSTSWYWLIPTALASSVLTTWAILRSNWLARSRRERYLIHVVGIAGLALSIYALNILNSLENIRNPVWWSWRFAKIQDPDVLFGESMMHSVGLFGNSDNIFFAGEKMHYHWFSFAWNDTLNALFQTDPFAITAVAAPVFVIFVIMCLVATVAARFSKSHLTTPIVVLAVSSMCAGPIPFVRMLHPYSYSFNFSLIYTLGLIILLLCVEKSKLLFSATLMFVFSSVLFGSKVSSAIALVSGLLIANLFSLVRRDSDSRHTFAISSVSALTVLLLWFFNYYSSNSKSADSVKFGPGVIFEQKAFMVAGLPVIVFLFGFICISTLVTYSLAGIFWLKGITNSSTRLALKFSLMGGFSSLIAGVLFFEAGENLAYLIQMGIALVLPISIIAICNFNFTLGLKKSTRIVIVALVGVTAAKISWSIFGRVTGNSAAVVYKSSLAIVIPVLIGLAVFSIFRFVLKVESKSAWALFSVLTISAGTLGSYVSFASGFYQDGGDYHELRVDDADMITGSADYRELLVWLRNNSEKYDLVATNRYCSDSYDLAPNCMALWNLTSAISGRQVLVEGLYPPNSQDLDLERENRRLLVDSFVNFPSIEGRAKLEIYGVRWVVADFAVTKTRSWGDFAIARFTNSAGSVLDLERVKN
ncbi:MAG: hypothetical protein F2517_04030 [Actinobacteria bacterium]|nr:hypothetical protein [Actinomycetota bacterium]